VLSKEEILKAIETECKTKVIKDFFIFSCFTGLDNETCMQLRWKNYVIEDGTHKLKFTRSKTDHSYGFPLSKEAIDWLSKLERKADDDKIFVGLTTGGHKNNLLLLWIKDAGITKHITPHCGKTYILLPFLQEN
jgi:integrase